MEICVSHLFRQLNGCRGVVDTSQLLETILRLRVKNTPFYFPKKNTRYMPYSVQTNLRNWYGENLHSCPSNNEMLALHTTTSPAIQNLTHVVCHRCACTCASLVRVLLGEHRCRSQCPGFSSLWRRRFSLASRPVCADKTARTCVIIITGF